jgi:hypothetical protein
MKLELLAQGAEVVVLAQQPAQHLGKLHHHHARLVGIGADQRRDRVQRVEQEVRIDLAGERGQARFHQQPLLLLELAFRCACCSRSSWEW